VTDNLKFREGNAWPRAPTADAAAASPKAPPADLKKLQKSLADRGVKYLFSSYVDLHGVPKGKMVPIDHLEQMMAGSELYTGAALDGVPQDVSEKRSVRTRSALRPDTALAARHGLVREQSLEPRAPVRGLQPHAVVRAICAA
jgi:glutamine synthetase